MTEITPEELSRALMLDVAAILNGEITSFIVIVTRPTQPDERASFSFSIGGDRDELVRAVLEAAYQIRCQIGD